VFALSRIGDVSDPVRTPWGWDVIVLFSIRPERRATREEAFDEIRQNIFDTSRRAAFLRWADALVGRARVHRNDDLLAAIEIGEGLW
jgi:hypothetical protein